MPEENKKHIKDNLKEFSYYFVDFFMSVLVGFGLVLLLNIPMKFIRTFNIELGEFIIHFLGMCIALYVRCYRRGYSTNKYTHTFQIKKVILFVALVFVAQVLLVLILGVKNGGHAVYIAGPSRHLAGYVLPLCKTNLPQNAIFVRLNWLFMIGLDVLVYAPIMIIGEYLGTKASAKS